MIQLSMPRVADVDKVAPDDIVTDTPAPEITTPQKTSKKSKTARPATALPPAKSVHLDKDAVYRIMGHTRHSLSSLLVRPEVFNFREQSADEEILIVARQHWFANVPWILVTIVMILVPTLLQFVPLTSTFPVNYVFVLTIFWYLMTFAYSFEKFLYWYFNVYIITSEKIVDIDFNNLLSKKYTEAKLEMIQDVTSSVIGAFPTIFNYGNVFVQTASEVPEIIFDRVANPEKIIKILQELREDKH